MGLTTSWDNQVLDWLMNRDLWLAYYTDLPGKMGGGVEVAAGLNGYARVPLAAADAFWDAAADSQIRNGTEVAGGTPTGGDWGVLAGYTFHTDDLDDTPVWVGIPFASPLVTADGTPIVHPVHTLVLGAD